MAFIKALFITEAEEVVTRKAFRVEVVVIDSINIITITITITISFSITIISQSSLIYHITFFKVIQ